ncbi:hypothetical protein D915_001821 [Fasciola hepatica]|uniref:Uncharacterized protein n=1 Tax=Fasciola hepatica TaxID=6192 RepID=A0A4E0RYA9_FASHE|nr:hypothetical protein D915_001821 [Fasciola hepatica]
MDDPSTDFLDTIISGEERTYHDVYQDAFRQAHSVTTDSVLNEADRKQFERVYLEGLYSGAKLSSELCSLYGLVTELVERSDEFGEQFASRFQLKRGSAVIKAATDLRETLIRSPGLLKISEDNEQLPVSIICDQPTFEQDIAFVRSKAKLLQNLLDVHLIERATNQLSF